MPKTGGERLMSNQQFNIGRMTLHVSPAEDSYVNMFYNRSWK